MILFVSSSSREASALVTACDHRSWAAYACTTVREFRPLAEKIQPRVVVSRHRLLDGYSDDVLACLKEISPEVPPRMIVLMSADRTAQTEARQISLGADCVLHDPVRMEILVEYLARYRSSVERANSRSNRNPVSFSIAGVEVHPHEHLLVRGEQRRHIAPQEVALLRALSSMANAVVPYPVLYGELFGRRFEGDTANCRVLLCKVLASFKHLGIELKPFIQVIPKSGYLYSPSPDKSRSGGTSKRRRRKAVRNGRRDSVVSRRLPNR